MRISDWSSDVCSSDLRADLIPNLVATVQGYAKQERSVLVDVTNARARATSVNVSPEQLTDPAAVQQFAQAQGALSQSLGRLLLVVERRSEEHTSELQSLMRISYAVFCLKKKIQIT